MRLSNALTAGALLLVLAAGPGCFGRRETNVDTDNNTPGTTGGGGSDNAGADDGKEDEEGGDTANNSGGDNDSGNDNNSGNDNSSGNDNNAGNNSSGNNDSGGGSGGGNTQNYTGNLAPGDGTLNSGEYVDHYTVSAQPGQTVTIEMVSASNLDPYLILNGPNGQRQDNDDATAGDTRRSRIEHTVIGGGGGTFDIIATSFQPGETGAYTLNVTVGGAGSGGSGGGSRPSGGGSGSGGGAPSGGGK